MPKSPNDIIKILEWIETSKRAYPNDTDTIFLSRLINTHYADKKSIDSIYEAFQHINRPQKAILEALSKKQPAEITGFSPYFLHFSWGLFQKNKREAHPDKNTAEFQHFNAQTRTIAVILMLARLANILHEDKKLRRQEEAHTQYFKTINTLIESGHLNIAGCTDMKAKELTSLLKLVEAWMKLPLLSEESVSPDLDITRHETRERIRLASYKTLASRCEKPMEDEFRWDFLESALMEENKPRISENISSIIANDIHDDMQNLYNEIQLSIFPRTTYERSQLKRALISGYIDTLRRQEQQGYEKVIDLNIHMTTLNRTFIMAQQLVDHCDENRLRELIAIRGTFTGRGARYYREHLGLYQSLSMVAPHHSYIIGTSMLLSAVLIALTIAQRFIESEEAESVSRRASQALIFVNIVVYMTVSFILDRHKNEMGNHRILLNDTSWVDSALTLDPVLRVNRETKFSQEKKAHDEQLATLAHENQLRLDKPSIVAEQKKQLEEEVEKKLKAQSEADKKLIEAYEQKMLTRQREEKEEALRIKEARRRAHYQRTHEKSSGNIVVAFAPQALITAPAREPAAPAPKIAAVIAEPPQPKQPAKEAPAPVVMFAVGDKRREEFIGHVRALLRIIHRHMTQPQIKQSPEGLSALKYDLIQICEHIFSIRSSQKEFCDTLIHKDAYDFIYKIRNGLIHHDHALQPEEKHALYLAIMNQLSEIAHLHRAEGEIQLNTVCHQAQAQPETYPIQLRFGPALEVLRTRLIAPQQNYVMNNAFKESLEEKNRFLAHIIDLYLKSNNAADANFYSKALLMTIAELGEIYKEIFVKQKLVREFGALYPRQTFNDDMIERFISVRRDIVHIKNPKEGDVGVIVSNGGSVFIQDTMLRLG